MSFSSNRIKVFFSGFLFFCALFLRPYLCFPQSVSTNVYVSTIYRSLQGREINEPQDLNHASPNSRIKFSVVPVEPDLRLKKNIFQRGEVGLILNQVTMTKIWSRLINIQKDYYNKRHVMIPAPPIIDFDQKIVLWYTNQVNGGGVTSMNAIMEYDEFIVAEVSVVHTGFKSNQLNLWSMPATEKPIFIREIHFQNKP